MDNFWKITCFLLLIVVIGVFGLALFAPHTVQQYYLGDAQQGSYGTGNGFCVISSINWDSDNAVFCTDEINKAIEVMEKMNLALKGVK